jgi:hypothetical protein
MYQNGLKMAIAVLFLSAANAGLRAESAAGLWVGGLLMICLAGALLFQAAVLLRELTHPLLRCGIRTLRKIRKIVDVPPAIRLLHTIGWAVLLLVATATVVGYPKASQWGSVVGLAILGIAGAADLLTRANQLLRFAWNETLGKIFTVSVGAALIAVSVAVAKHWVHATTHVDPKYLTEATAVIAALTLPAIYGLFCVAVLFLFAILQFGGLFIFMFATSIGKYFTVMAGENHRQRSRMLWYRISKGKRPPGRVLPPLSLRQLAAILGEVSVIARPFGTLIVLGAAATILDRAADGFPRAQPYLVSALVWLEYRTDSSCVGLPHDSVVAYMEDGNISTVRRIQGEWKFAVAKCTFSPINP